MSVNCNKRKRVYKYYYMFQYYLIKYVLDYELYGFDKKYVVIEEK